MKKIFFISIIMFFVFEVINLYSGTPEPPENLKATKLEAGKTELTWSKGNISSGEYVVYCRPDTVVASNNLDTAIILKTGINYIKTNFIHILGNYDTTSYRNDNNFYYAVRLETGLEDAYIFYDDSNPSWVHPGTGYIEVEEFEGDGYGSGKCMDFKYSTTAQGGFTGGSFGLIFMNAATTSEDISDYTSTTNGKLAFYAKVLSGDFSAATVVMNLNDKDNGVAATLGNYVTFKSNSWVLVEIPLKDLTPTDDRVQGLKFDFSSAGSDFHIRIDKCMFYNGAGPQYSALESLSTPVANRAVMREVEYLSFDKTVKVGYEWKSFSAGDYIGYADTEDSPYSVPEEYSYDGSGAVLFGYSIVGWGGVGLGGTSVDLTDIDKIKFYVRGFYRDYRMQNSISLTFSDPGQYRATTKAFSLAVDREVEIPIKGTGDWEEVVIPRSAVADYGAYWWRLVFSKGSGAFAIDHLVGVDENIWDDDENNITTPVQVLQVYPNSHTKYEDVVNPTILFNRRIDPNKMYFYVSTSKDDLFATDSAGWPLHKVANINNNVIVPIDGNNNNLVIIRTNIRLESGKIYYFGIKGGTDGLLDYYGNTIQGNTADGNYVWSTELEHDLLQFPALDNKCFTPAPPVSENIKLTFTTDDPGNEVTCILLDPSGVPVGSYIPTIATANSIDKEIVITGKDVSGNYLSPGLYILYLEVSKGTDKKSYKTSVIIR